MYATTTTTTTEKLRDGKEPEPSKNEPNQNPGFAKNRTEPEPKYHGSYSVLSLNEIVGRGLRSRISQQTMHFTLLSLTNFK